MSGSNAATTAALGSGPGSKRRLGDDERSIKNPIVLTEEDCLPEHSEALYAMPGWSKLGANGRAAVILRSLGWLPTTVQEVTGVSEKNQKSLHTAVGEERRQRLTKRDILVIEYIQVKQLQEAALSYITPMKLMATSAKDLAIIVAMNADKARDIMAQIMKLDDTHPEAIGEVEDPLDALERVREEA